MTKGINFFSMSRVETDRYQYACADKARACIVMAHKYITDGLRASESHPVVRRKLVNMRTIIEEGILNTTACIVTPEDVREELKSQPKPRTIGRVKGFAAGGPVKGKHYLVGDPGTFRDGDIVRLDGVEHRVTNSRDIYIREENAKRGFPQEVRLDVRPIQTLLLSARRFFNSLK